MSYVLKLWNSTDIVYRILYAFWKRSIFSITFIVTDDDMLWERLNDDVLL